MKKSILVLTVLSLIMVSTISCKDGKNEGALSDAKEVADAVSMASTYVVDTSKSVVNWKGNKPTGSHNGTVNLTSGSLSATNGVVEAGSFVIDMTTITSLDLDGQMKSNLESHLKGTVEGKEGDFFNITQYPTAIFELTGVTTDSEKTMIQGNLTIKEKSYNVEFPATVSFTDDAMSLTSDLFAIDRTKWGVNYGSKSIFDNLGDKFIDDEIELTIELHATKS